MLQSIHHHYHLHRMKEMDRVFWCHSLGAFGTSIALIFVPILLLKSGYSFQTVLLFLLGQQVLTVIAHLFVGRLFRYVSAHHLMAFGGILQTIYFAMLASLDQFHWPLWVLACIWAVKATVYFTAFHYVFSLARAKEHAGRQVAGLAALVVFMNTIAPAIGGIVGTTFGIQYTYIIGALVILTATLPMLRGNVGPTTTRTSIKLADIKTNLPDLASNVFNGVIVITEAIIWPIFVFVLVSSYAGIGILSSVVGLASIAVTLFVGRDQEKKGEKHYIKRGALTYSITSLARTIVQNAFHVFGLNLLAGVGRSLYVTPYLNRYYTNSDNSARLSYIIQMETSHHIGPCILLAILLLLSIFFSMQTVLVVAMVLAGFAVLGVRLIR